MRFKLLDHKGNSYPQNPRLREDDELISNALIIASLIPSSSPVCAGPYIPDKVLFVCWADWLVLPRVLALGSAQPLGAEVL